MKIGDMRFPSIVRIIFKPILDYLLLMTLEQFQYSIRNLERLSRHPDETIEARCFDSLASTPTGDS